MGDCTLSREELLNTTPMVRNPRKAMGEDFKIIRI